MSKCKCVSVVVERYKASRDIPLAVKELETISPSKIAEWVKNNRVEKSRKTGKWKQKVVDPSGITHWLNRHPQIKQKLVSEIRQEELPKEAISETLFQKECFQHVPCIKQWIIDLINRDAKQRTIKNFIRYIKYACQGKISKSEILEGWGLKHPSQLTIEDAKTFIYEMKKRGIHSRNCRLAFRNFFKSRGMTERQVEQISGKEEGAGKYAHLYTSKPKIYAIFEYLKKLNETAYLASKFAYKTASRIGATLNAEYKHVRREDHIIIVLEKANKGQPKRRVQKVIPFDLWQELELDNSEQKHGKLFNIRKRELNALLRRAYKEIIPELADDIPMPFHFWRHQFAQHMLRALKWNYGLVASLGHWSMDVLRKYYGKPPQEVIKDIGLKVLPQI